MYGGEERNLHIKFKDDLIGVFIDRFGKDIPVHPAKEIGYSETHVDVAVSNQFFGWLFALGTDVELLGPKDIRRDFADFTSGVAGKYIS